MEKLEHLKEINKQFYDLEETKTKIRSQIKDDHDEEKLMQFFQKEKERLAGERDELVECLKQIDNDITAMENIIVQTETERVKTFDSTRRLVEDYRQRRIKINKLRSQLSLPSLENDEFLENLDIVDSKNGLSIDWSTTNQQALREQILNNSASSMLNKMVAKPLASKTNTNVLNFPHHHSDQNLSTLERRTERASCSTFMQHPPPMKMCLACSQQIHRNAPICPYCKAKSRSRNPKKPKRKVES